MKALTLILLSSLIPFANTDNENPNKWVAKQITVDSFVDLEVESTANIVVLYNDTNTLQINGEDRCVDNIAVDVSENKLHLKAQEGFEGCKSEIVIGAPKIKDINVKNGGIINLTSVSADTMFASIEGGGVISLDAKKFLYGKIKNGGVINYKGEPFVHTDILNEGEVKRIEVKRDLFIKRVASGFTGGHFLPIFLVKSIMKTVDDYIYGFEGDQKEILLYFHHLLSAMPGITSKIRFNIPFYYQNTWVCYLNPVKPDKISLCFLRGYEMSNEHGLLESKGRKHVLSIDFSSVKEIPEQAIKEIINEAFLLDEMVPYKPKGKSL